MITHARMKKFVVDNRIDKDGHPDPFIQLQVEMVFSESIARELAHMTTGEQILLSMEAVQREMDLDGDQGQLSLLDGAGGIKPPENDDLAGIETATLITNHAKGMARYCEMGVAADGSDEIEEAIAAIVRELYSRGLTLSTNDDGTFEWAEAAATEAQG